MSSKVRLVVAGAGGHGAEVLAYVNELLRGGWNGELVGFLDDEAAPGSRGELTILGPLDALAGREPSFYEGMRYLTALGANAVRRRVVERMESLYAGRIAPWTLIHPTAWIGSGVTIGEGTCVAAGAILTTRVRIGRHCIVNVKASVSHDCVVGDFANLNPGATLCGNVTVGDGAFIGAGATVIQKLSVGRNTTIGAGSVVTRPIPENVVALGAPARVVRNA